MQETKYGRVQTELGNIPEDEPVFIFRGKDLLAPSVISAYVSLVRAAAYGLEQGDSVYAHDDLAIVDRLREHADAAERTGAAIVAWQAAHPDRCKLPD